MTDYEAVLQALKNKRDAQKFVLWEAKDVYYELRRDPYASPEEIESARREVKAERIRWHLLDELCCSIEEDAYQLIIDEEIEAEISMEVALLNA